MIHPTADVQTPRIGEGTTIWQYCVILKNADADLVILGINGNEQDIVSSESNCYETYFGFKNRLNILNVIIKGQLLK